MASAESWKQHEHEQLRAWLNLSYRQRLDWLWQAKLFAARACQAANERHAADGATDPSAPSDPAPRK